MPSRSASLSSLVTQTPLLPLDSDYEWGQFLVRTGAVDAVAGRVPVILDSGIRRGIDVFKALALGATAVAVGRPVLWGLAAGGAGGVKSVYSHLAGEMKSAMLLSGVAKVTDIKREHHGLVGLGAQRLGQYGKIDFRPVFEKCFVEHRAHVIGARQER